MAETNSSWDTFKTGSAAVVEKIKAMIHEGNVRRVIIEQNGRTVAEFPLTAGVVGAVLAPVAAAVGAVVALFKDCTIHVQRASDAGTGRAESDNPAQKAS
jgi:hypothetical protein